MTLPILVQFQASEPERLRRNSRRSHYRENEPSELKVKAPLYSQQVDKDVGTESCNDNGSEASPLAPYWKSHRIERISTNFLVGRCLSVEGWRYTDIYMGIWRNGSASALQAEG